ncbi:MAG: carboxymuconolactone decarboxylase family protein [Parvularculaceae bacterium]|nr:carboxymuconolactone decarboxylase family protein [Parvularculaceae bacterium]
MTDPQQRIPSVPKERWTDEMRDVFAILEGREGWEKGSKWNFTHFFVNHPALARAWLAYNRALVVEGVVEPRLRELVILRTAHNYRSAYEWDMHEEISRHHLGMTDAEFEAIKAGPDAARWSAFERDCLRAVDQLCRTYDIDDALWAELEKHLDHPRIMELMFLVGSYGCLSMVLNAVRMPPERNPARLELR